MRVVVHLRERETEKSYMLDFGKNVTERDVEKLLEGGKEEAAAVLFGYSGCLKSNRKFEILPENRADAELTADFVIKAGS